MIDWEQEQISGKSQRAQTHIECRDIREAPYGLRSPRHCDEFGCWWQSMSGVGAEGMKIAALTGRMQRSWRKWKKGGVGYRKCGWDERILYQFECRRCRRCRCRGSLRFLKVDEDTQGWWWMGLRLIETSRKCVGLDDGPRAARPFLMDRRSKHTWPRYYCPSVCNSRRLDLRKRSKIWQRRQFKRWKCVKGDYRGRRTNS